MELIIATNKGMVSMNGMTVVRTNVISHRTKNEINGRGCSRENYATTAFFDIEKGAWRSFRWETLVKVY